VAEAFRVGFAGTPPFAATALAAILAAGFEVGLVLTRPDARQGRGLKLGPSAVKTLARARRISVLQPPTLKDETACDEVTAHPLDVLVVAAYGLLLPSPVLEWPRYGCLNIHASRLPRGAVPPIERALLEGDAQTGISIMRWTQDSMPDQWSPAGRPDRSRETPGRCISLAAAGAKAMVECSGSCAATSSTPLPGRRGASYAAKIERSEADRLGGNRAAIDRRFARSTLSGARDACRRSLKIWDAEPIRDSVRRAPSRVRMPGHRRRLR
jgi:methionyl-tRNA formyltransferase